jgi:hypothetical protein
MLPDWAESHWATFDGAVPGRGMQYQAEEVARLVAVGGVSQIMPPAQSVAIMQTLDEVRRQIGLRYPGEA